MPEAPEPVNIAAPGKRPYHTTMTPAERRARSQAAGFSRWAKVSNRTAATRPARAALAARYYAAADAAGVTDPELRGKMARAAQGAEMARLRQLQLASRRQARQAAARTGGDG